MGGASQGSQKARYAGTGAGRGRRGFGLLGGGEGRLPHDSPSASDWVHKTTNVLDSLPKSVHGRAKAAIKEITEAEDESHAQTAIEAFAAEFGAKWPKAVAKIVDDKEALLTFYDYPALHWRHLRTTNPIESVFAPVRARTDITKGPGSRRAGLAMIFKLMEAAEGRWRKLTGAHLVALVRAAAKFRNGELVEGNDEKVAA